MKSIGRPTDSLSRNTGLIARNGGSASTPSDSTSLVQKARAPAAAEMSNTSPSVKPSRFNSSTSPASTDEAALATLRANETIATSAGDRDDGASPRASASTSSSGMNSIN